MGWAEDYNAKITAQQDAEEARKYQSDPGFLGGFVSSAASSVGELFGQDPWQSATEFRQENPWSGLASELIGTAVPYAGMFKLSKIGKFGGMLERATERVGTGLGAAEFTAVSSPVRFGAVKEMLRYSPLELSRLGIGFATGPDDSFGDLLADVGLSTVLTGGFGAIGGFFRAGGVDGPVSGGALGKDLGLKPTFELRMLQDGADVTGDLSKRATMDNIRFEALTELPYTHRLSTQSGRYVDMLENGSPDADKTLNKLLFKAQSSMRASPGISKRLLVEGADDDLRTLNFGEQQQVVAAAGFKDIDDLASTLVYPRLLEIKSPRGAGTFAKAIDDSTGFMMVEPGVMIGRETGDGLWVVAKQLKSGAAGVDDAIVKGTAKVAKGDQWLIGKTDKPQRFAPAMHKIAEDTVNRWSKLQDWARPSQSDDVINKAMNMLEDAVSPVMYEDIGKMSRAAWIEKADKVFTQKILGEAGLTGSTSGRTAAAHIYDVLAPTVFKERSNSMYGRLMGQLNNVMRVAKTETVSMVRGAANLGGRSPMKAALTKYSLADEWENGLKTHRALLNDLTDDELELVVRASHTQTPAEDLAKLSADGRISEKAKLAVAGMQANDEHFMLTRLMPALEAAGVDKGFEPLKGYILPRIFKGDYSLTIVDERGVGKYLSVGSLGEVKAEAKAVIEEAAARGLTWRQKEAAPFHAVERSPSDLEAISDFVSKQIKADADVQDILQTAMRKMSVARGQKNSGYSISGEPGAFKERTGIAGTADRQKYSRDDLLASLESHYAGLMQFAAYHSWRNRYMQLAMNLEKTNPTLGQDIQRKAQQLMGIEGKLTKVQNELLRPILGTQLGAKAATKIAQATNQTMYLWNLAFANPTFALLNLMNPLQTVMPWISHMTTIAPDAAAKTMSFMPKYGANGLPNGTVSFWHPMKVMKQAMGSLRNPTAELRQMQEQALTDGTLLPQHYEGFSGTGSEGAQTLAQAWKEDGMAKFLYKGSTWMADKSEQISRMTAFNAAYHLGQDYFGLAGDQLYRFVQQGTRATMYGYSVVDRARMFTGPVGSMFGLFKNWQFHFMGNMMEYAGLAAKGNFAPLLYQSSAALALGGLGATPLKAMADGIINYSTNGETETSFLWLQEQFGKEVADPIFFGLPAFMGASLQASSQMPGTDVRNETANLFNVVILQRAMALGKAVGGAWDQADASGTNALRDSNVRDQLIGALAPRAVFRATAALEGDYIKSMSTGAPQVRGISPMGQVLHGLGFNQVEVEKHQIAAKELWKKDEAMKSMIGGLGKEYAEAMIDSDWQTMQAVVDRAVLMNVPLDSVMKSAQNRQRRELEGDNLSRFNQADAERYLRAFE